MIFRPPLYRSRAISRLRPRPGRLRDASVAPGHLVAGAGAAEAAGAQRGGLDHGALRRNPGGGGGGDLPGSAEPLDLEF